MESKNRDRGTFVAHVPCPACKSSDANSIYEQADGTYDAYCFSCEAYDPNPDWTGEHDPAHAESNVKEMLSLTELVKCPTLDIPSRGLSEATCQHYGVRSMLSSVDRTPVAFLFPYYNPQEEIVAFKRRPVNSKNFFYAGQARRLPFFGQNLCASGGKRLYVTEGEFDALALYQVLKDLAGFEYRHIHPNVVSIPNGARSAARVFAEQKDFLSKFQEIVLAFDQDDDGKKATEQVASIVDPSVLKVATFSEKDPNDMLLKGKSNELKWAVLTGAKTFVPSGISTVGELSQAAFEDPQMGEPWPWPSLTRLTYGKRPGIYLIGGGVGVGKTEVFHEVNGHIIGSTDRATGVFLFEEAPSRTIRTLCGKILRRPAHLPDKPIPKEDIDKALNQLMYPSNKVYIFDHKWDRDWKSVYTQIKHIIQVHGVRDIFIDPLTVLVSHEENTDRALHGLMDDISLLTQDPYNCTVYISAHLNEPPRHETPHEEGGRVKESQFAGSRAMIRYANYVIGLERNKQDEDPEMRNTITLRVLKDRDFGSATGETISIFYNPSTGMLEERAQTTEF